MKKKALVLAVCMAIATPTITAAKILSNDFVGLSFGEIKPKSFLNEPFKGLIPILFTDIESSKKLKVKIASDSIFKKVGAEKLPVLDSLQFKIKVQNNKPVILIESKQPIRVPFLNFILEIETPKGRIYQDYTTLLDPKNRTGNLFPNNDSKEVEVLNSVIRDYQLLAPISSLPITHKKDRSYVVKSGDTLSEIANALNSAETSLQRMITAIHRKNPKAFVNNDINRLKAGQVLNIPNSRELTASQFKDIAKAKIVNKTESSNTKVLITLSNETYIIKKGDTLSSITKSILPKNISFTKMMKAIHVANPHAFSKNRINILKIGKLLRIPSNLESVVGNGADVVKPNPIKLKDSLIKENVNEFKLDGFIIEKGDTLASVAEQIGYKNIPQAKMMKAIYLANPEAFEKNNITTLIEGAIIRLPSISEVRAINNKTILKPKDKAKLLNNKSNKNETSSNIKTESNLALKKLEKRVRELKRDLSKADTGFSKLEVTLLNKENIIKKQSKDLQKLALSLTSLKEQQVTSSEKTIATKSKIESITRESKSTFKKTKISSPEAQVINDINNSKKLEANASKKETELPLSMEEELLAARVGKSYIPENVNEQLVVTTKNLLKQYGVYMSGKELFSTILALLLGLLLIRYRREIYSYTRISYDHPKYYPPFDEITAKEALKERSITFHDTVLETHNNTVKFSGKQLDECEELVDELMNDLDIKTNTDKNTDWKHLNEACDAYISEYKNENALETAEVDNKDTSEEPQPEEMTFELFEALAEGIATKEKNTIIDDTTFYNLNNHSAVSDEHADSDSDSVPTIFDDLVKLSEKTEIERMYIK